MKGDEPLPVVLDGAALDSIRRRLRIDALGIAFGVMFAFACFVVFVAREGKRFLRVETEMALAREIHQVVAPRIERRLDRFEFFGASLPSSEVGGDLVDLERLKAVILEHEGRPLTELFDIVVGHARRHGPQIDDQSLLLVRCL
jgi:hypothetical protein